MDWLIMFLLPLGIQGHVGHTLAAPRIGSFGGFGWFGCGLDPSPSHAAVWSRRHDSMTRPSLEWP